MAYTVRAQLLSAGVKNNGVEDYVRPLLKRAEELRSGPRDPKKKARRKDVHPVLRTPGL